MVTDYIFIVEGEKDADNLVKLGVAATCNQGGAGKWRPEYTVQLRGLDVVILPDNDEAGEFHAWKVRRELAHAARSVAILRLPGLPPKGDASDWIAAGGTRDKLIAMAKVAAINEAIDILAAGGRGALGSVAIDRLESLK